MQILKKYYKNTPIPTNKAAGFWGVSIQKEKGILSTFFFLSGTFYRHLTFITII